MKKTRSAKKRVPQEERWKRIEAKQRILSSLQEREDWTCKARPLQDWKETLTRNSAQSLISKRKAKQTEKNETRTRWTTWLACLAWPNIRRLRTIESSIRWTCEGEWEAKGPISTPRRGGGRPRDKKAIMSEHDSDGHGSKKVKWEISQGKGIHARAWQWWSWI